MENFTAVALFVATIYAFQNLVRYAKAADWNGVLGILLAMLSGWAAVALGAHANVAETLHPITQGPALGELNWGSQIMLGIAVGSSGTVLADLKNSFDSTGSAEKPMLVNPPGGGAE